MRKQYTEHLKTIATKVNHALLITLEYAQNEMQDPPFSVHENEVRTLFEQEFNIECLFAEDRLEENYNFKQKGLSHLVEKVYSFIKYP